MTGQSVEFHWHIVEDENWWAGFTGAERSLDANALSMAALDRLLARLLLRAFALLAVGVLALGSGGDSAPDRAQLQLRQNVRAAIALERDASQADDIALWQQLVDERVSSSWRRIWRERAETGLETDAPERAAGSPQILSVRQDRELVLAELLVHQPQVGRWQVSPYRETRFYRQTDAGFQRTLPDSSFWGPGYLLETDNLRFAFTARDAAVMDGLTEEMQAVFVELHEILGYELPSDDKKLKISIQPDLVTGAGLYENRLELASPHLAQIPAGLSADTYLSYLIVNRMAYLIMYRNTFWGIDPPDTYRWREMQWGLRRWLENRYVAEAWPWNAQADALFRAQAAQNLPLSLADITLLPEGHPHNREYYMWRNAVAKSVVAYAVDTYGTEKLPQLVRGLARYYTWSDLLGGVYGVSIDEFEAGWNRYLTTKYGVASPRN